MSRRMGKSTFFGIGDATNRIGGNIPLFCVAFPGGVDQPPFVIEYVLRRSINSTGTNAFVPCEFYRFSTQPDTEAPFSALHFAGYRATLREDVTKEQRAPAPSQMTSS